MNTFKTLIMSLLVLGLLNQAQAQDISGSGSATPKDMLEIGVNGGYAFVSGDVDPTFGYGFGGHIRKALDYVFSIRADALYLSMNGDNESASNLNRTFDMTTVNGTIYGVISLNSFRFDRVNRKLNYYALIGAGANYFETNFTRNVSDPGDRIGTIEREITPHASAGAGIAFRLGPKVNIGIEHLAFISFGNRADLIDGNADNTGAFRDVMQYSNLKVNFNLGNASNRSEPLYWVNPLDRVMADIDDVKRRTDAAVNDTDGDGVIDAIDQEPNTPSDVPVDTKGRTLDSDKDGVPDFRDVEPYYPPRAGEQINEDGVVINPINRGGDGTGGGVTEERVQEMIDEALEGYGVTDQRTTVSEFFLPMIHFATDSYTIKYSDYGTLASIAQVMKSNTDIKLVVNGFTDALGGESYNTRLSYERAKAVVDHMVNNHAIGRGRLIIHYSGQENALVPKAASYMNRRVEFRVAKSSDNEMDPPVGGTKKEDGY